MYTHTLVVRVVGNSTSNNIHDNNINRSLATRRQGRCPRDDRCACAARAERVTIINCIHLHLHLHLSLSLSLSLSLPLCVYIYIEREIDMYVCMCIYIYIYIYMYIHMYHSYLICHVTRKTRRSHHRCRPRHAKPHGSSRRRRLAARGRGRAPNEGRHADMTRTSHLLALSIYDIY